MRFAGLHIGAVAAWLPDTTQTLSEVVSSGAIDATQAKRMGVTRVPVSMNLSAPDMAVKAARLALQRGACDPAELDLLIHGWTYFQGHDIWSPPHYISHMLGALNCQPISIHQGCDAGALGLQIAATRLLTDTDTKKALVTTADRFTPPAVDRWNAQPSMPVGDSGTAVLLERSSHGSGPFDLLSLRTRTAAQLEVLARGTRSFQDVPARDYPITLVEPFELGLRALYEIVFEEVGTLVQATLKDAHVEPDDPRLRIAVLPRCGEAASEGLYVPVLSNIVGRDKLIRLDDSTGHLTSGDWGADLNDLSTHHLLEPGEMALLLCAGLGITWACAVVEATRHVRG